MASNKLFPLRSPDKRVSLFPDIFPDEVTYKPCGACGRPGTYQCSVCKELVYCSRQCQTDNWPSHRRECKDLAARHESPLPLFPEGIRMVDRKSVPLVADGGETREISLSFREQEDGYRPYSAALTAGEAERDLADLAEADDVVLPGTESAFVTWTAYTGVATTWEVRPPKRSDAGFTLKALVARVMQVAQAIFYLEDQMAPSYSPMGGIMLNRGWTKGPFCVSMHELGDLGLHTLYVTGRNVAPACDS
ncbi:hypothetical protein DFJ74DRAFT_707683 [Hyaloraphidium curvatum]|nr:hypothetical protein DFJ74DRAFT_707683 [Hyaloraphidium curvatum]